MRVPKTGSTTLFEIINKQTQRQFQVHGGHLTKEHLKLGHHNRYKIYAFYRDPYTRFVACWQRSIKNLEKDIIPRQIRIMKNSPLLTLNDITPELIRSITVEDTLRWARKSMKNAIIFYHQHNFCTPNTILFDFNNYESNVRTLLDKIGLDSTVEIKKTNSSNSEHIYETITDEEKNMIVDFYKPDYDYFASRGIYFESNQ